MLGFSIIDNRPSPGLGRKKFIPKYSFVPDGTRFRYKPIFPALKRWAIIAGEMARRRYRVDCSGALRPTESRKGDFPWRAVVPPLRDEGGKSPRRLETAAPCYIRRS